MCSDRLSPTTRTPCGRTGGSTTSLTDHGLTIEAWRAVEAEWLLAMHVLGIEDDAQRAGIVQGILNRQREDGSWEVYYDAPMGDINATVESIVAKRMASRLLS